jgi:hypothetical protein
MKSVARRLSDGHLLALIKSWLEAPVEEHGERGDKRRTTRNKDEGRGTPQGGVLSPLLANLYFPSGEPHLASHGSLLRDFTPSGSKASWQTDDGPIPAKRTTGDAYLRTGNVAARRSESFVPNKAFWSSPSIPGGESSPNAIKKLANFISSKAITPPKPPNRRALYQST